MNKIEITVLSARVLDALSVRGLKAKTVREFERYGTRRIVQHCLDNGQTIYFKETVQDFVWQERARMESGALPHYQWVLTRRAAVYLDQMAKHGKIQGEPLRSWEAEHNPLFQNAPHSPSNSMKVIDIICRTRDAVIQLELSDKTKTNYIYCGFGPILNFFASRGEEFYSPETLALFVNKAKENYANGTIPKASFQTMRKAARWIEECLSTGRVSQRKLRKYNFACAPPEFENLLSQYQLYILWKFDNFCAERFPEKDSLDRELALAWLEKRDTENTAGHRNRIMVIREFAKYLRAVGTEAYMIPISMTSKGPRYVPHIFNEAEIKAFFHGADSFRPHEKAPARHLVIPVFYRLLYCCGLRPAEARLLKKENVDLVRGAVYVVESKGHKDRVVAVADDLLQIMRSYSTLISEIYPDSDYFFPRYDGEGPYTKRWTEEMFWRCFSMAGITAFEGPKPRVYDFRHTFATECICRWMREGRDIDAMLPFLSAYMGHARYEDTLYYVHMVPDFYERVGTVDRTAWEKLLPEVHDEG